jgi:succinyl-CoA synthetase beta subunit
VSALDAREGAAADPERDQLDGRLEDGEPADVDAVAGVVARLGDLALASGDDMEALEVNPLRVDGATVEALDATVTWTRKENE